jgi:hypothetical protein
LVNLTEQSIFFTVVYLVLPFSKYQESRLEALTRFLYCGHPSHGDLRDAIIDQRASLPEEAREQITTDLQKLSLKAPLPIRMILSRLIRVTESHSYTFDGRIWADTKNDLGASLLSKSSD